MRCDGGDLPHIQYQLDDPGEYVDEHIIVIGSGDAGIENALGLAADPAQDNIVTILNRSAEFARAKQANVDLLMEARDAGRINILSETTPARSSPAGIYVDTPRRRAEDQVRPDHRPHGLRRRRASSSRTAASSSPAPTATPIPTLSPQFETTVPGIYVIGALAGYPLIKHCMNQGYDVGRVHQRQYRAEARRRADPGEEVRRACRARARSTEWLAFLRSRVDDPERAVAAADARVHARFRAARLSRRRDRVRAQRPGRLAVRDRRRLARGRGRSRRPVEDRADRAGLDRRRGRADLGPQARRHGARRRGLRS